MDSKTYRNITRMDLWIKINFRARHLYSNLYILHCSFGGMEWFFHSEKELAILCGCSVRSISRAKKMLIYYGLIKVKRVSLKNGAGGRLNDNFHLCDMFEILESLRADFDGNEKDLNRVGVWLSAK